MKKIVFDVDDVLPHLSVVSNVVNTKNVIPVLDCVAIQTSPKDEEDGRVEMRMAASDGDMWLRGRCYVYGETDKGVSLCVDAKSLTQALSNLGGERVVMSIDEKKKTITCKYSTGYFSLPFVSADEFPAPSKQEDGDTSVKVIEGKLLAAIERVKFAVASDKVFVVLNSVHLDFLKDGMISAATDKRIIAVYKDITSSNGESIKNGLTLPKKACGLLTSILDGKSVSNATITYNDRNATIKTDLYSLTTRLMEYNYPAYTNVIPKDNDIFVEINKDAMAMALKRMSSVVGSSDLVELTFNKNNLNMTSNDVDFNRSTSEDVICVYDGELFKICLSFGCMVSILSSLDGENITMSLKSARTPVIFKESVQNENYKYLACLMPMQML